ncbi:hypothetical protein VTL71DRAFT_15092 [Oculimacula yallundae]|uniref:Uncharacterized protein n=1 Tax=Oculimacula yallundae TaxID=86028 RepID=A0ABR4CFL9_9HELO
MRHPCHPMPAMLLHPDPCQPMLLYSLLCMCVLCVCVYVSFPSFPSNALLPMGIVRVCHDPTMRVMKILEDLKRRNAKSSTRRRRNEESNQKMYLSWLLCELVQEFGKRGPSRKSRPSECSLEPVETMSLTQDDKRLEKDTRSSLIHKMRKP